MIIVVAVVVVLLVGAAAAWVVGRADVPGVAEAVTTESARPLPAGPLDADDVHDVRFDQAVRGYRMAQVDDALARLGQELRDRDVEIARLRDAASHSEGWT
ncbi:DivIVA domain-containing protein [Ornithinimicrobium avium]|uniref:DivIVA domain-containing protein n=1 Tax=Ornithinimicrobium avium TaxID=2283195 RepID=A0A345NRI0_9MICO|nr:DivIVA domain-containing protein [Ornithinimicrobium avium]AXH97638.1 DivIVA domain-containing protein [Ornithinimicrobium avium]